MKPRRQVLSYISWMFFMVLAVFFTTPSVVHAHNGIFPGRVFSCQPVGAFAVDASTVTSTSAHFSWVVASADVNTYLIIKITDNSGALVYTTPNIASDVSSVFANFSPPLNLGAQYQAIIEEHCGDSSVSTASPITFVVPGAGACIPVQDFSIDMGSLSTSSATFNWSDPAGGADHYVIVVRTIGGTVVYSSPDIPGTVTSFTATFVPPLNPYGQYEAIIEKYCDPNTTEPVISAPKKFNFIVQDNVVYLKNANPTAPSLNTAKYERVANVNQNLVPSVESTSCGTCSPSTYISMDDPFLDAYHIQLVNSNGTFVPNGDRKNYRFAKSAICDCLHQAADSGYVNQLGYVGSHPGHVCEMNFYTLGRLCCTLSANITGQNTLCAGTCTTLTANTSEQGCTFQWSSPSGTGASISVCQAGTYTVTATSATGCTATASITVTQLAGVSATIAGTNCFTTTTTLTANPGPSGYTYLWNTGATTQKITVPAGTYQVTVTKTSSGCTSVATKTVCKKPTVFVSPTSIGICSGLCAELRAYAGNSTTFAWSTNSTANPISICPSAATTTYTVTATNASGCSATKTVVVTTQACNAVSGCASPYARMSGENEAWNESQIEATDIFAIEERTEDEITPNNPGDLVKAYPNPASKFLVLDYAEQLAEIEALGLYDLNGKKMLDVDIFSEGYTQVDVSGLPAGVYVLRINGTTAKRVVLAR